ncbi:hypothetical protein [Thaumasiovibrio sp. DFM-14]|uniref:hypothetical protein n=1 Tax=Thaumasiovibrio sp. DFM-14 TaxID=3384792 RepID=UPI0039A0E94B
MLDTPEEIEAFREYQGKGGYKKPLSQVYAQEANLIAGGLSAMLAASISGEVNYEQVERLASLLVRLNGETDTAVDATAAFDSYIDLTAHPDDLTQVSIGVDVYYKLEGIDIDGPAASTVPIIDPSAPEALIEALEPIDNQYGTIEALMTLLNSALTPPDGFPGTPNLPDDLVREADSLADLLEPLESQTLLAANVVAAQAKAANEERVISLGYFESAVSFTIISNGADDPAIGDAIDAIYPD